MQNLLSLVLIATSLANAKSANDWGKPCFHGECAYDLAGKEATGHGVLKISGNPRAITDITPAAGWVVLECDSAALAQEIRMVCKSHDATAEGCSNLFAEGAKNKVVRLPESCGPNPFARVNELRVAENQDIPTHMEPHVARRDGQAPQVHILSVDTNWAAVDATEAGAVTFAFAGANVPGFEGNVMEADWNPFSSIKKGAEKIGSDIKTGIDKAGQEIKKATTVVKEKVEQIQNWSFDDRTSPKVLDISKSLTLLDVKQQCGPITAGLQVDVSAQARAEVVFCIAGAGTLIPPKIDRFQACAILDADINAKLTAMVVLNGVLDSGRKAFFQQGIPGLSIPGIVAVGPYFELAGQAKASVDINLNAEVGIKWQAKGVQFWMPPSAKPPSPKSVAPLDTPVDIQAGADFVATGTIEGHVFALLKVGIDMFLGKATASGYIGADAYGQVQLTAQGSASASLKGRALEAPVKRDYTPPYSLAARAMSTRELQADNAFGFSGCLNILCGIAIIGGVEGNLMGFFKASKEVDIFRKEFQLFKKCYAQGTAKRSLALEMPEMLLTRAENLAICPKQSSKLARVASETVKAANIR
ncbi:hypothetical protein HGRIS_010161 [Hohenbuehelia grisea]|uniref:Uncharacterized protein n=1 Tax=Hohenbuehelia grisea TaxID=104357 RepID=A0ABR3J3U1_9AGAR